MNISFVDLKAQYQIIKEEIDQAIGAVLKNTSFIGGSFVKNFEEEFAAYCTAKHCVGVGNGTDALYVALRSLGVGAGDEVITAANSFIATSEAVTMTGARVVFVDCEPKTYNIDPVQAKKAITGKTKAIVPVHLYGRPADMFLLRKIADEHGLFLVEDAAQAHGAEIEGMRVGTLGDVACFSFYPGKNLGAYGDGGAIVTNAEELAVNCRMIANHGRITKYDHEFEGVNSRLDALQAAILSVKLKYIEKWTRARIYAARKYNILLKDTDLVLPDCAEYLRHVYHLYVVRVKNREQVQIKLKEKGIASGVHYPIALPNLRAYRYLGHRPNDFPVATRHSSEILSLPMFPEITDDQIEYVCTSLKNIIKEN